MGVARTQINNHDDELSSNYYSSMRPTFRSATMMRRNLLHRRTQRTGLVARGGAAVVSGSEAEKYIVVAVVVSCLYIMPDHVHLLGAIPKNIIVVVLYSPSSHYV